MTRHSPSSTRLDSHGAARRSASVPSLLDERARSRRRWAFVLALGLNVLVWKALASLPQATGQAGSSGAIEWSRVEINPLPPKSGTFNAAALAPKSLTTGSVQREFPLVAPQPPHESQTRIARATSPEPKPAPQRPTTPQRVSSVVPETLPMRHNPDLETPMTSQENRQEQNQPEATPDVRSTNSQNATWTTPKSNPVSSATSAKARPDNALPLAGQTPSSSGNATPAASAPAANTQAANAPAANTSHDGGASSTRSADMAAATASDANSSASSGHRSGTDFASGFRDGSSRSGSSSSVDTGGNRGDMKGEGGNLGGRSNGRMSAPDAQMRELPDLKPRSQPSRTPRPEPRATPREESRPVATPRPQPHSQPQETPRRMEERSQPTPETERAVEKPRRSIEIREAQADHVVKPRVPKRLRREKRRMSVGLDVDVDESGRATPRLRESSGDSELDEEALKAARKTRWKPRAEDGKATKSTQRMRYNVDVKDGAGNDNADENEE